MKMELRMTNDHKPNRRQRRAMNRIGNKIADRIVKQNAIKKVRDVEKEETYQGDREVSPDANNGSGESNDTGE